jgi:hypothetical protein
VAGNDTWCVRCGEACIDKRGILSFEAGGSVTGFAIVAAVNDHASLIRDLSASRCASGRIVIVEGQSSAGAAYNTGMHKCSEEIVAFVHQDVYLPMGWEQRLAAAVDQLEAASEPWAVLGVWGIAKTGRYCGKVWCTGGNQQHVGVLGLTEVSSIDEIVIVLKRSSGLHFDEKLPGFHLYATDIVMEARERGMKTFVFDGPVIHNSRTNPQPLDRHFWNSYRYMQRKWAAQLPLKTCVVTVTRFGWPLWKQWGRNEVARLRGRYKPRPRLADPAAKARELGYEREMLALADSGTCRSASIRTL